MSWKKPFVWKGSGRYTKTLRARRPMAIAIAVVVVFAAAMLFAAYQSSAPGAAKQSAARDVKLATKTVATAGTSEPRTPAAGPQLTPVTITGCLVRNDETFRLKDTTGADAPRSRSWKTAFLKKGSAPIEVVDASNRLKMDNYVGQRVSLTGTLVDREMRARTLQRVAPSCTASKSAKSEAL